MEPIVLQTEAQQVISLEWLQIKCLPFKLSFTAPHPSVSGKSAVSVKIVGIKDC